MHVALGVVHVGERKRGQKTLRRVCVCVCVCVCVWTEETETESLKASYTSSLRPHTLVASGLMHWERERIEDRHGGRKREGARERKEGGKNKIPPQHAQCPD